MPENPLSGLVAPADLARRASAGPVLRGARGADFDPALGSLRCAAEGRYGVFYPDFEPGTPSASGLAYAIYRLHLTEYDSPTLNWATEDGSELEDCWIGLSDFERNCWRWYESSDPALADLAPLERFIDSSGNRDTFVAVVFTGETPQRLKYIRFGGNLNPIGQLKSTPPAGVVPLAVVLDASGSYDIDGEVVSYSFWVEDGAPSPLSPEPHYNAVFADQFDIAGTKVIDDEGLSSYGWYDPSLTLTDFKPWPSSGQAELPVCLACQASCEYRGIDSYEFDPEGDGSFLPPSPDYWHNYVYLTAGTYQPVVRITDSDGNIYTTSTTVAVAPDGGQPRWRLVVPAPRFSSPAMAVIGGRPAIATHESTLERGIHYIRADDALGIEWSDDIYIATDDFNTRSWPNAMAEIAGSPAVIYIRSSGSGPELCYRRAVDVEGTAWDEEKVVVSWADGQWFSVDLAVVNGNPAVAACRDQYGGLHYVRALDDTGSAWPAPSTIWTGSPRQLSLDVVNGNPAIAFTDTAVHYLRATDPDGTAWPPPSDIAAPSTSPRDPSLAVANGKPCVAFTTREMTDLEGALCLVRASDASGSAWLPTQTLDSASGEWLIGPCLASVSGTPSIAYIQAGEMGYFLAANDADGADWPAPLPLDSLAGYPATLLELAGGQPAILWQAGFPYDWQLPGTNGPYECAYWVYY